MPEHSTISELSETPHAEVFETREPRTVRLELDADEGVPAHTHPGTDVVLHLLSGRLELSLDGERYDVEPGELVRFSGEREVEPHALEHSIAIIVFAPAE